VPSCVQILFSLLILILRQFPASQLLSALNKQRRCAARTSHARAAIDPRRHWQFFVNASEASAAPNGQPIRQPRRKVSGFAASTLHSQKRWPAIPTRLPRDHSEKNNAPGLASLSSFFLGLLLPPPSGSGRRRTIAPFLPMERYDPVANASERTPSISTAITTPRPSHQPPRQPLVQYSRITVASAAPCFAGPCRCSYPLLPRYSICLLPAS